MFKMAVDELFDSPKLTGHLHKALPCTCGSTSAPDTPAASARAADAASWSHPNDHVFNHLARDYNLLPEDVTMWSSRSGGCAWCPNSPRATSAAREVRT